MGRFLQEDKRQGFLTNPQELNLYPYVLNNPLNFIDPWGWGSEKPWWEKLGEGYYFGTSLGEEAAEWYAQQEIATGNPLWGIPGTIASAWTPETYQQTGWTLLGAKSFVYKGTPAEPIHYGFDLPGARNIIHYGKSQWGRHIGIWFRESYKAWKHIYFKPQFPFFRIWP